MRYVGVMCGFMSFLCLPFRIKALLLNFTIKFIFFLFFKCRETVNQQRKRLLARELFLLRPTFDFAIKARRRRIGGVENARELIVTEQKITRLIRV
jgi:hypothetical protein